MRYTIIRMIKRPPKLNHIGESTQNHDQSITSTNFKTMNIIVRIPTIPTPPELPLEFDILLLQ